MNPSTNSAQTRGATGSLPRSRGYLLLALGVIVVLGGLGILLSTRTTPIARCDGAPCLLYFYADQ
jgi:hypothetical protein